MLFKSLVLLFSIPSVISGFHTSKSSTFIYDDDGRVSIFHGFNFVFKSFPWYPEVLRETKNIEDMARWGTNTVRLGVLWSGAQPIEGKNMMQP